MGTRTCAGAWSIDLPGVPGKAPAAYFSRRLVTATPTTTISRPAGRAFPSPSKPAANPLIVFATADVSLRYPNPFRRSLQYEIQHWPRGCNLSRCQLLAGASLNRCRTVQRPVANSAPDQP